MSVSAMRVIVAVLAWFGTSALDAALVVSFPALGHVRSMVAMMEALAGVALFALILRTGASDLWLLMRTSQVMPQIATAVTCHALASLVTSVLELELLATPLGGVFFLGALLLARARGGHAIEGVVWAGLGVAGCMAAAHYGALGSSLTVLLLQGGAVLLFVLRNDQCAEALEHTSVASVALQWFVCRAVVAVPAALVTGSIGRTLRMDMLAPVTLHALLGMAVAACNLVLIKRMRGLAHGLLVTAGSSVAWALVRTQLGQMLTLLQVSGLWVVALAALQFSEESARKRAAPAHAADVPAPRVLKAGMVLGLILLVGVTMPRSAHDLQQMHLSSMGRGASAAADAAAGDGAPDGSRSEHHVLSSHPPQTGLPIGDLCVVVDNRGAPSAELAHTVRSVLTCGHRGRMKVFLTGSDALGQQRWNHDFHEVTTFRAEVGIEEMLRSSLVPDPPVMIVEDAVRRQVARDAMTSLFSLTKCIASARRGEMVLFLDEGMAATRGFVHELHTLYDEHETGWNVVALDQPDNWPSVAQSRAILFHPQIFERLLNSLKGTLYEGKLRDAIEANRMPAGEALQTDTPLMVAMDGLKSGAGVCWVQEE